MESQQSCTNMMVDFLHKDYFGFLLTLFSLMTLYPKTYTLLTLKYQVKISTLTHKLHLHAYIPKHQELVLLYLSKR